MRERVPSLQDSRKGTKNWRRSRQLLVPLSRALESWNALERSFSRVFTKCSLIISGDYNKELPQKQSYMNHGYTNLVHPSKSDTSPT